MKNAVICLCICFWYFGCQGDAAASGAGELDRSHREPVRLRCSLRSLRRMLSGLGLLCGLSSRLICGGRGTHLACNFYGMCWLACN